MAQTDLLVDNTFSKDQRSRLFAEVSRLFPTMAKLGRDRLVSSDRRVRELAYLVLEAMELEAASEVEAGAPKWKAFAPAEAFINSMKPATPRRRE